MRLLHPPEQHSLPTVFQTFFQLAVSDHHYYSQAHKEVFISLSVLQ